MTVSNTGGASGTTSGTTTVTETLPTGYTAASFSATGWSCSGTTSVTCTSTQAVAGGASFPVIGIAVAVPANAPNPTTTSAATASGGGATASATSGTVSFPVVQVPATMTAGSGTSPQSAAINTAFGTALSVTVKDAAANPVSGVSVIFTAPASGASGVFSNSTARIVVATNGSGVASAPIMANSTAGGPYTVTAAATGLTSVNFSLTNTQATIQVTVGTNINGPTVTVDGGAAFTGAQLFTWAIGSNHTIATATPQVGGAGTQYVWLNWSDAQAISHGVTAPSTAATYTANFKTQYPLTTTVSPSAAGGISPASGYVDAGTIVAVSATANSGYAFTGFSGALAGAATPQNLTVNAPSTVTANFTPGPTSLGGSIGFKTGPLNARVWPIVIGNNGPGAGLGAEVTSLVLTQTAGAACTPVTSAMPAVAGDIGPHAPATANVTIDFSGCANSAFFKVTANLSANGGAVVATISKLNQLP